MSILLYGRALFPKYVICIRILDPLDFFKFTRFGSRHGVASRLSRPNNLISMARSWTGCHSQRVPVLTQDIILGSWFLRDLRHCSLGPYRIPYSDRLFLKLGLQNLGLSTFGYPELWASNIGYLEAHGT